jgi:tetratricopeptide (TPR) repeat protein
MITLAFIYWLYEQGEKSALAGVKDKVREAGRQLLGREELQNRETYALLGFGLFIFIIMWQYNIKPYNMLVQTIAGQKAWAAGNPVETIEVYKKALSQDTILDRDSRTSLIRLFASGPEAFSAFPEAERLSVADYLIELAERNVAYNKEDSLNQLTLAQMLDTASKLAMNDPSRFVFYNDRALEAVNAAIAASPGRPPVYYQKAQILLTRGDKEQALETIRQAYALNEIYQDSACHLGKTLLFMEKEEEGLGYIDKCIDLGGARLLGSTAQMKSYIPRYQKNGQSDRIIKIYETVVNLDPSDTKAMIELAKLYAKAGQTDKAINMAAKISEKDPSVRSYVDDFIKSLD